MEPKRRMTSPTAGASAPPSAKRKQRPVLDLEKLRASITERQHARAERLARMAECERMLRRHQEPPEQVFQQWVEDCDAEGIDATLHFDWLLRPLHVRLDELFGRRVPGWSGDTAPFEADRVLSPKLRQWGVVGALDKEEAVAELVTYLEDARDEVWRRRASRSPWRVAEAARAEAVLKALNVVISEARAYARELRGDDVEDNCDPGIAAVFVHLLKIQSVLRNTQPPPKPSPARKSRPQVGPTKNWGREVLNEVTRLLGRIRPWNPYEDDAESSHKQMLKALGEKILSELHVRSPRGIGSKRQPSERPSSNPSHDLARRICASLEVQHVRPIRKRR